MVHHMEARRDVLVEVWLRLILCHVVEVVDVREGPTGELICVKANLEEKTMMIYFDMFLPFPSFPSSSCAFLAQSPRQRQAERSNHTLSFTNPRSDILLQKNGHWPRLSYEKIYLYMFL